MKRRDFLKTTPTLALILSCAGEEDLKKISTDRDLLGKILYTDSNGDYILQSDPTAEDYVLIISEKDYNLLEDFNKSGVDSTNIKPAGVDFSFNQRYYPTYKLKK